MRAIVAEVDNVPVSVVIAGDDQVLVFPAGTCPQLVAEVDRVLQLLVARLR